MIKRILLTASSTVLLVAGAALVPARAATHTAAAMTTTVTMKQQAFSGVTGTATLTYNATAKTTTVKIMVMHLLPNSVHPAHIHSGNCSSNGPVLAALSSVKANAKGVGTSTTVVSGSFTNKASYINVHLGPGLALTGFTVLACGQISMGM